jgi:AcrR family transcriptional regulator
MAQAVTPKKAAKPARSDGYALRARILRNAADVFGELGAADTTVEHILVASDVSRRTFYRFFKSKEDVLDALHEIGCNILLAAAAQSSKLAGDPIARLSRAIEVYVEYHVTVGTNVMHVVQGESMRPGSRLEPRRRAFLDSRGEMFEREMNAATGLHVDPMLLRSLLTR